MLSVNIKEVMFEEGMEPVLTDMHFEIEKGEILLVRGSVGSGKTTLLKTISGIIPNIEPVHKCITEISYNELQIEQLVKDSKIAYCPQNAESSFLFDQVKRQFYGMDVDKILSDFGILHLKNKSIKDISTGQRKLISVLAALNRNTEITLLDEPTINMDDIFIDKVLNCIVQHSKDKLIIISSHNNLFQNICTKALSFDSQNKKWIFDDKKPNRYEEAVSLLINAREVSENGQSIVKINDYSCFYPDGTKALNKLNCEIFKGEILGIVGKNGSGKTTLIKQLLKKKKDKGITKCNLGRYGVVYQENNRQFFTSKVIDELYFMNKQVSKDEVNYIINYLQLQSYKDCWPIFLSGGQKQKLLIAAVLLHKPDTLFLDEPFENMDQESIDNVIKLIEQYQRKNNMTVIITDQNEIILNRICSRIIAL